MLPPERPSGSPRSRSSELDRLGRVALTGLEELEGATWVPRIAASPHRALSVPGGPPPDQSEVWGSTEHGLFAVELGRERRGFQSLRHPAAAGQT